VKAGETIETIAKQYEVTPFDILALNPDAKSIFGVNTTLIIPNSKVKNNAFLVGDSKVIIDFRSHRVKRKETLYSLSKEYNVSIDELKKANPSLYSENLQKGDRIKIPRFKTIIANNTYSNTIKKYNVQLSEGKWRIAHRFGITVQELGDLNPNMKDVIALGDVLNVPNITYNEELPAEAIYNYYEVLPKEGFYRLKVKLGLTQQELEALNPGLNETGLKDGMVLKLPLNTVANTFKNLEAHKIDLRDRIKNKNTKRLAILLPFKLYRMDTDSIIETKGIMKSDKVISTALDFHSGILMALDSAKQLGVSANLKVFDTENRISEIANILDEEDFSGYDAIIGPMMTKTFDRFATDINNKNVPIFAPLAKPSNILSNVYQTIPDKKGLSQKIIDLFKADMTKTRVIIIADQKHRAVSNTLKQNFPNAKQLFSEVKDGKDNYFIHKINLEQQFKNGKNIVFVETEDVSFGSSVISLLNGLLSNTVEIVLTTTDKGAAFESTGPDNNYHLSNLKFHYATIHKEFDMDKKNGFIEAYTKKYGVSPNKYASRGFDLTLDILLRLAAFEDSFSELSNAHIETEYIENKFRYSKTVSGGYINEASYIVKYDNLKIIEAK
jgi:LysM repeat protein